jgi:hypothetical protein
MPLTSRLEHPGPRLGRKHVVAEERAELPSQHVGIFVFPMMPVQRRCQSARRERMVNDRKALAGLASVDLPVDTETTKIKSVALAGIDDCGTFGIEERAGTGVN